MSAAKRKRTSRVDNARFASFVLRTRLVQSAIADMEFAEGSAVLLSILTAGHQIGGTKRATFLSLCGKCWDETAKVGDA